MADVIEEIAGRVLCSLLRTVVFAAFYEAFRSSFDANVAWAVGAAVVVTLAIVPWGPFDRMEKDEEGDE